MTKTTDEVNLFGGQLPEIERRQLRSVMNAPTLRQVMERQAKKSAKRKSQSAGATGRKDEER